MTTDTQVGDQWGAVSDLIAALEPFALLAGDDDASPVNMNDPLSKWVRIGHLTTARDAIDRAILSRTAASFSPGTKGEARSEPKQNPHPIRVEEPVGTAFYFVNSTFKPGPEPMGRTLDGWTCYGPGAHPPTYEGEGLREKVARALGERRGHPEPWVTDYDDTDAVLAVLQALQRREPR